VQRKEALRAEVASFVEEHSRVLTLGAPCGR
jgi:hypothetical protein